MRIIGHRGAKGLAPENTIGSIGAALEAKVDAIEVDVRTTRDGVPVLFHNAEFGNLQISLLSLADLKQSVPNIATLEQAIKQIDRAVPIMLEVKAGAKTAPIVELIKEFINKGWQPKDFIFGSFRQQLLRELHAQLPEVPVMVVERFSGIRASYRARQLGTKMICLSRLVVWWGYVKAAKRRGYRLYVFTINNPRLAKRWIRYGLTGIITDFPDRFKSR